MRVHSREPDGRRNPTFNRTTARRSRCPKFSLDAQHNGHSLLPEIQPLDEHHEANGDHLALVIQPLQMGADAPRATRRRTRANSKNKMWLLVGLGLWLFAIFLWIGFCHELVLVDAFDRDGTQNGNLSAQAEAQEGLAPRLHRAS